MLLNHCVLSDNKDNRAPLACLFGEVVLEMGAPYGFGVREKKSKRVKGRFHKETVGVLVGVFWLLFWANRKRNALAAAKKIANPCMQK